MALPCLSALSVRVPVSVGVTAEERSEEIHNLSNSLRFGDEPRDVKIGHVNALLALIKEGGNPAKNEILRLWQRITMTRIVPELLDLLCDGSKEVLQLFASFQGMTYQDMALDTIGAMIQKARANSLVAWPGVPACDPIPSLMEFLFGPDDDAAEMAAGILDGMHEEDQNQPSAILLKMLELGLVGKTVKALTDTTDERRREPLRFIADCCLENRSTATIVHNSMVEVDGYKLLFQYLTSKLEDFQPLTHAFVALRQLLDVHIPQTPGEATLFIEPLVADKVWTSTAPADDGDVDATIAEALEQAPNTIANEQRDKILEYVDLMASKSPNCALGIAYYTSFLKNALDYSDDALDLLDKLEELEVPWLQLYIGLERRKTYRELQEIVPTKEMLLGAIRANGDLYGAIERYSNYHGQRVKMLEAQRNNPAYEFRPESVAAHGTSLLFSLFNAKPDEMHEAAAKAALHPNPGSIKFVLNKYMEDLRQTNVSTPDDVSLRQEKERNMKIDVVEKIDVVDLLTPDQKEKLERYDEYMRFVDILRGRPNFLSFSRFVTKRDDNNKPVQRLEDDIEALIAELERPMHTDETWTLRHIVSMYGAGEEMEKMFTETQERRRVRPRTSAAALRAALAARVGATARV